jgi:glycosyltransferase involved in cell wall biosynthesis
VATIHDLGYRYFPQAHTRRQVAYLNWSTRHNGRRAKRVIADSEATKLDLVKCYDLDETKIQVVYPGYDPALGPVRDGEHMTAVQHKYGIDPPYLLYLGTLQPRKNLVRLVEAFAALPDNGHQLVLAGGMGWRAEPILAAIEALETAVRQRLLLPGYIADGDKAALISGATALLYPSLYEGFGFPVLEANACGTPVICSNASSLPEVAGDAALLVDPLDVPAITAAIARLLTNETLQEELIRKGFENVQRFNWHKMANELLDVFEQEATDK